MNLEETREILEKNLSIVKHYGAKRQMPVWVEELSELTKVICKWMRKYDKLDGDINDSLLADMKEEITDVIICIDQLRYIINFAEDALMKEYKFKVDRQLNRIKEESEEEK